jgi:hypothetical protein
MNRCFLTGVEVGFESAHVLNRTVLYRLLRGLKQKAETLERLLEQLGPVDEAIVRRVSGEPPVTKKHRRLVSKAVADVLRQGFGEPELFIPFATLAERARAHSLSQLVSHPLFGPAVRKASPAQLETAVGLAREVAKRLDPKANLPSDILMILQAGICLTLNQQGPDEILGALREALESDRACAAMGVPAELIQRFRDAVAPLFVAQPETPETPQPPAP